MSPFLTIGLGASAGGIKALKDFFEATPPDAGMAYVVILHLSPSHDSQLAQVLQSVTEMPVAQVVEKTRIEADHVYVIPPDKHLTMVDGCVLVSANTQIEERRAPVDIFFRSLAESHGPMAVGVVLSGTGANGSMGLKRVKEQGGAVFVQNPREAEFTDMPRAAIATDLVDDVLNAAEIPAKIIAYRDGLQTVHIPEEPASRDEEIQHALREVLTQLRLRTGHDFANYKRPTLLRRIERRINVHALPDLPAYAAFLLKHPEETHALLKDLLISVTNFFRDSTAFEKLETDVLPKLLEGKGAGDELRIWVAACATGEEAYSIAMQCADLTMGRIDAPKVQILATDIDDAAITTARDGLYTLNDAADVSPERLARHFTREGDSYRIRRELRDTILFASHNFLKDPPFSRIDLVACRNVLIYLNHAAQQRVMETFHFALKPGGFLMLGLSESVDGAIDLFSPFRREQHIWQSRQVVAKSFVVPDPVPRAELHPAPQTKAPSARAAARISFGELHQRMLEQYAPPSLVVNEDLDIVHQTSGAVRYLQLSGGEPTQAVLKIIRDELRADLRTALYQAARQGIAVTAPGLKLYGDGDSETINIHVRPVLEPGDVARGFILVIFEKVTDGEAAVPVAISHGESASQHLEAEVARLRAQLRSSAEQHEFSEEELKAGNEELQALNEELRSASEELETSKEELQSINEELATVNQELKVKVEEAGMMSNNLRNIINSTDVGTIILDRSFRVTLFSPAARGIFNLIPSDHSRPLSDITHKLADHSLLADAEGVLQTLHSVERELDTTDGRSLLMRISPYRTDEDHIQGVVLTFLEITERRRQEKNLAFLAEVNADFAPIGSAEDILTMAAGRLGAHLQLSRCSFSVVDDDADRITTTYEWRRDKGWPSMLGERRISTFFTKKARQQYSKGEPVVTHDIGRNPPATLAPDELAALHIASAIDVPCLEGGTWKMLLTVCRDVPTPWRDDEVALVQELATRIYIRVQRALAEEALQRTVERLELAASVSGFGIHDYNIKEGRFYWSPELKAMQGWPDDAELSFEAVIQTIHPDDRGRTAAEMQRALTPDSDGQFAQEFRVLRGDTGEVRWFYNRSRTTFEGEGATRRAVRNTGIVVDITERKRSEEALRTSEERLRVTVESAADYAIITTDPEGIIKGWSRGAERAFGWKEAEVLGTDVALIFTPEDRNAGAPEWERETAASEGHAPDERWHIRKDGARFFMSGVLRPIMDGHLTGFVKVARDLTERRQAEEALRISEERYRTSLQAAGMGAWDWNMVDNTIVWNEQHYLMLGARPEEGAHDAAFFLSFVHPEDLPTVNEALRLAAEETGMYQAEFRIIRADNGAVHWMAGFGRAVSRWEGRPVRMLGVMYDITARRRVEEQREEFIGIASHELKTPLAALKAYAEVLQDMFAETQDEQSVALMEKMEGQIDRLAELIRALLDVTRVREGRLELRPERFDLAGLVEEVADDIRLTTRHHIEVDIAPGKVVEADRERIRQVVINLFSNAVKYSPGGDRIVVTSKDEEGMAVVSVQDFGIGMSPEVAARVFERFYRADDASVSTYPGLGLGLYISAEIVESHGGRMWVESSRGEGSTFCFSLPVVMH